MKSGSLNTITRLIVLGILVVQCSGYKKPFIDKYFNLQQFIDQQITSLKGRDVRINKTLKFGDNVETLVLSELDSGIWAKELKIFREHDINKPYLVDAYNIKDGITEENLKFVTYHSMDSSQSGVIDMEIVSRPDGQVARWRSGFKEENLLYSNFRQISMVTGENGILNSYEINGYHKQIFKDTVHFQIQVKVNILD